MVGPAAGCGLTLVAFLYFGCLFAHPSGVGYSVLFGPCLGLAHGVCAFSLLGTLVKFSFKWWERKGLAY